MDKNLIQARDNIIEAAGRATQGFGLGRIIGQLYALLFFSPRPLSLDEMAQELGVSKGSVSTNIRELEKWGAARAVWIKGSRRDFYEAEVDYLKILREGILPVFQKKVGSLKVTAAESRGLLEAVEKGADEEDKLAEFYRKRLSLIDQAREKMLMIASLGRI